MPFGEYADFEECVAKNSDKDDPEAYCATIKRQVEGKSLFGFVRSAVKAIEDVFKQTHPHGDHTCVCPECGTKETVGAGEPCKDKTCPKCGAAMRAETTGEFRGKGFSIYKDAKGDLRWLGITSNHFRDRDDPPDIIESKAHEDFVTYLDQTKDYPPLLLWHTPDAEVGRTDFADFSHGFLITSGTINKGMESVAQALTGMDLGMSHGFRFKYADPSKHIIGWYRSFENSVLPREYAANPWTSLEILQKEAPMNAAKKAFLDAVGGKGYADKLEAQLAADQKARQDEGIEFKAQKAVSDYESFDACVADNQDKDDPEGFCASLKQAPEAVQPDLDAVAQKAVTGILESEGMKALIESVTTLKAIMPRLEAAETALKELKDSAEQNAKDIKKTHDEIVAEAFKPRAQKGVKASQSDKTLVTDQDDKLKAAKPIIDPWFAGIPSQ